MKQGMPVREIIGNTPRTGYMRFRYDWRGIFLRGDERDYPKAKTQRMMAFKNCVEK